MTEAEWQREWNALAAQRTEIRRRLRGALDDLGRRAHDPVGVRRLVRDHPYIATGAGAAVGALLVKLLVGAVRAGRTRTAERAPADLGSALLSTLRTVALSVATPLVTRFVTGQFQRHFQGNGEAARR